MNVPETLVPPVITTSPSAFNSAEFLPGLSVDCVIFGFHDCQLKVLLLETAYQNHWRLVGGFVPIEKDVDEAANAMLRARTGLEDIFLRQFHLFGSARRSATTPAILASLENTHVPRSQNAWLSQRFVSVGYYALVDYATVTPHPTEHTRSCAWWDLGSLPPLIFDHQHIIATALESLRLRLGHEPIGYNLLPEKFTMPELQKLYEAVLGRELDRRNFQRKMLSYGILLALEERRTGGRHKSPRLYSFDLSNYQQAMEQGLKDTW